MLRYAKEQDDWTVWDERGNSLFTAISAAECQAFIAGVEYVQLEVRRVLSLPLDEGGAT